jgi:hypothetical protein
MNLLVSRLLLAVSALILALGAVLHAKAFPTAAAARIDASSLPVFLGGELKALWLADSTTLLATAAILSLAAVRPTAASGWLLMLVALIPAATAVMIYAFLGGFYAGHLLMAAAAMAFVAGLMRLRG